MQIGALEGQEQLHLSQSSLRGNKIVELSAQNIIDCAPGSGCTGGYIGNAFRYVKDEEGIDDEASYPYEGKTGECRFNEKYSAFWDTGFAVLPQNDEQELQAMVANFGPVSVAIDASEYSFHFYQGGVYNNDLCKSNPEDLNHSVLVVGYGTDKQDGDFWIVVSICLSTCD